MTWPHWYAQTCAWAVAVAALGAACYLAADLLRAGSRRLIAQASWVPSYWDWFHAVWLPRFREAEKRRKERGRR